MDLAPETLKAILAETGEDHRGGVGGVLRTIRLRDEPNERLKTCEASFR